MRDHVLSPSLDGIMVKILYFDLDLTYLKRENETSKI